VREAYRQPGAKAVLLAQIIHVSLHLELFRGARSLCLLFERAGLVLRHDASGNELLEPSTDRLQGSAHSRAGEEPEQYVRRVLAAAAPACPTKSLVTIIAARVNGSGVLRT
jgi:hypothetical protein